MMKSIALAATLTVLPAAAFAQSAQPPVNNPSNTAPTNSAPVPKPGGATVPPGTSPTQTQDPAGGAMGVPSNSPNPPASSTMPATPPASGTPNPAGSGGSGSKP